MTAAASSWAAWCSSQHLQRMCSRVIVFVSFCDEYNGNGDIGESGERKSVSRVVHNAEASRLNSR